MSVPALIIEDNAVLAEEITRSLTGICAVTVAVSEDQAKQQLQSSSFTLAIIDADLSTHKGLEVFKRLRRLVPRQPFLMISSTSDTALAVAATKAGVADFIRKPLQADLLQNAVKKVLSEKAIARPLLFSGVPDTEWFLGGSSAWRKFLAELADLFAAERDCVLLCPPGTNSDTVAQVIHYNGSHKVFRSLDLAVFQKEAAEALFWTTLQEILAEEERSADLETEHCGTLHLRNIEMLSWHLVEALFQYLNRRRDPLNHWADRSVRVTLGVTSTKFLSEFESSFLKNFAVLEVPSLTQRREDIPLLAQVYLRKAAEKYGKPVDSVDPEIYTFLSLYDFPGNYTELAVMMELAVLAVGGRQLGLKDFPFIWRALVDFKLAEAMRGEGRSLTDAAGNFERFLIKVMMEKSAGDLERMAQIFDLPKTALSERMERLGLGK